MRPIVQPRPSVVVAKRWLSRVAGIALVIISSGCGPTNTESCTEYVTKVNAEYAECGVVERIDATNTCPAYLDRGGADCSEYYACLAEEIECREGVIVHRGEIADGGPDDRRCSGCL